MKKKSLLSALAYLFTLNMCLAQYCMLPGRMPYSSLQPGITNFQLNTINRTSSNSESAGSVVVTTGISTTLTAGQTYTISISHSEDTQFFAGDRNNLRVWIDYNSNFLFTNAGETVLSKDLEAPGTTYTATFIVPLSAAPGTVALRATAKMSSDAGHTLPTSCDTPADPLGYHGEMEDYFVVIENPGFPQSSFLLTSTVCIATPVTPTNNSTGSPAPTYSWSANPSSDVTFSPNTTAANPQVIFSGAANHTITCQATNSITSNSSSKIISVSNCNLAGLNENEWFNSIKIGPNPVNTVLNLQLPDQAEKLEINVLNCLGERVYEKHFPGNTSSLLLDFSELRNGVYTVVIKSGFRFMTKQVILEK